MIRSVPSVSSCLRSPYLAGVQGRSVLPGVVGKASYSFFCNFRWSIIFSHTPYPSVTYFLQWTVSSGLKCSIMLLNMKKARFSYFS